MAQGQARLLFSLVGQDKLSSAIEKSRASLDKFADASEDAGEASAGAFAKLTGTISGIPGKLSDLNAGFDLVGKGIQLVSEAVDELAEAEKRVNARRIFEQTTEGGKSAEAAMDSLAKATRGALSQEELIKFSNSMKFAGQDLGTISKTLETAFIVSQGTGREMVEVAETLRDSLITGAGTGFEFLGITKDLNVEIEAQAQAMGKNLDTMDTAQKSQFRLGVISSTLKDRLIELNVDVSDLSTTFQGFRTDIENARKEAADFAAENLGGTQKEKELAGIRQEIGGLFRTFETELNKNHADRFIDSLSRVTGVSRDVVRDQTEEMLKAGVVNERRVQTLTENLLKIREDGLDREFEAKREALKKTRQAEQEADRQRAFDIMSATSEIGRLEEEKNKAISVNNQALVSEIDGQIDRVSSKLSFLRGEIDAASFAADNRRKDALAAQKEAQDFQKSALEEIKQYEDRKKRAAEAAKVARAEAKAQAEETRKNLDEVQSLRTERRIEDLKEQKKFNEAEKLEEEKARREILGSDAVFESLRLDQRVLAEEKLNAELIRIRDTYQQASDAWKMEQETKRNEEQQRALDQEKAHLDAIAEFRRKHREQDLRQAEEFAAYASSLSGDLRRYDEDTATVIQGQAEITQALAQDAGNAAKQASAGIAAGGRMTESLIKNDRAAAATRAAFETAAGFASIAAGDVIGSTMHFTAAGLFAALAGGAGGKKAGARRGGTTQISRGGGGSVVGMGDVSTGNQVVVNVAGFVTGTTKDLGVQVANTMNDVQSTGLSTATV